MTDVIKLGKRTFTWSVVLMTIMWSVGAAALVPLVATAADCSAYEAYTAGTVVKSAGNSTVYELDSDLKARYYPHSNVFYTWHSSYDVIKEVPTGCFVWDIAGKGVNPRPGSYLVKTVEKGDVYAVLPGNVRVKLASADVAAALYGASWYTNLMDVHAFHWGNYTDGATISTAVPHNGMLVKTATSGDVYEVVDGKYSKVDGTLSAALTSDVQTVSASVFATLENSGLTVTPASLVDDPTQSGTEVTTTPPVNAGDLSVTLSADTPSSGYVYKNSTHNAFTKIKLTAGSEDVTIKSFVVQRTGSPATDAAFTGVNVLKDGVLLSSSYKSFNSEHQATFTEDVKVPANTSVYLTLVGKMANLTTYSGEVPKLALVSVNTDATVTASLPIEGNAMTINTTVTVGVVTITENPNLGTLTEEVGTTDVEMLNVKIDNGSANNINLQVESLRFNNAGSADDGDVDNLELVVDGDVVATAEMVDNYVTFDLSSLAVAKILNGKNETFTLRGDIVGGSGRTLDFDIKVVDDIVVKDLLNNSHPTPDAAIDSGRTITISRGTLNVSKTNTVQAGNIPENTTDLELGTWNFKVQGESITVSSLAFYINVNGTVQAADFTLMKLVDKNGVALTGTFDGVGAGDGSVTTTDSFTLPEGDNELKLVGKLNSDPAMNDWVEFGIDLSYAAGLDAKGDTTGDTITVGTYAFPNATVYANRRTITAGALSVTTLASPASVSVAAGTSQRQFSTVDFDATASSEDVKITAFGVNVTTTAAETNQLQNITFKVNDTTDGTYRTLSTTKNGSYSTAGKDELISVSLPTADHIVVKKGKKVTMQIYADISASCSANDKFQININNVANDDTTPGTATVTAAGVLTGATVTPTYSSAQAGVTTVGTAGGHLEVTLASDNPNAALMAADTNVSLAAFKFLATTTEDVELDYLYVTQVVTVTASSSFNDYDYIWFEDASGNEIAGTRMSPTNTNPYIDFADDAFIVEADGSAEVLYLKANLAPIGSCASLTCTGANGTPGHRLGYKITTPSTDVVAVGHASGSGTTEFAGSVAATGNTHYVYKAYPVVAKKAVGTNALANGTRDLYKFQVSAVNGDVALGGFTFDISTTTATVVHGTCYLYDVTDSQEKQLNGTAACGATGNTDVPTAYYGTGVVTQLVGHDDDWDTNFSNDQVLVSVATPRTFILRGNVSGAASGASVTTGLAGDSASIIGATGIDTNMDDAVAVDANANDDFIWSDVSDNGHADTTLDWTNGFLVSGLNSSTSTLETLSL